MESVSRPEATITKKQFARIHERIQNKYEEMQKRLEKSKSIDMLQNVGVDFDYKNNKKSSVYDTNEVDDVFVMSKNSNDKHVNTNNANKYNAVFEDVKVKEAIITKSVSLLSLNDKDSDGEDFENNVFRNSFKTSIESLTEGAKESDDSNELQTPTPKSIRKRIGSRITAVKNKRQEKKEKRVKEKKDVREKVEKFVLSNSTKLDLTGFEKKIKCGTVTVTLIDVSGFEENPEEKPRSLICRFRLGNEKRKSKLVKSNQSVVKFQEILSFEQYEDDNHLEVVLWDRDNPVGRTVVDLTLLKKEKTHKLKNTLEDEAKNIKIFMLITISGSCLANTLYDIDENKCRDIILASRRKYAWYRLCGEFTKVGHLWIVVYGAKGLSSHDCYCVLNLNNESVRTVTDYKTNAPSWMKIFSFVITDITSSLEVIINDEKKCEEVGKITIPLLEVDSGKKKWYALKDVTQTQAAKGQNARILLEINISWNLVKAAVRVVNLKEVNYLQADEKLDRHIFARNLSRAKSVISWILNFLKIFKTCFQWESRKVNITALVVWTLFWSFGKVWMSPLLLLIPFVVYNYERISFIRKWKKINSEELEIESKLDKDEKSLSLRQRLNSWQEMIQVVQNSIGKFASLGESVKNLYNFSVPFISYLAIFIIVLIAFIMYLIPFNYICIVWGIHKFTQKIFNPNRIPHNEIMDLISRVPDDEALEKRKDIPLDNLSDEDDL
ncbi:multiple C2 and transmembrane domain-containing protein-like [Aricia agestis]|uniref:multiple C2 and transmembrane domain-containing protein-like n=1 Tax=Aricia agestis TaxID=91739 RepID=UPI001C208167|nr:multiple C2 and transmembrane domain-containing protein-like [Aricia agestis]